MGQFPPGTVLQVDKNGGPHGHVGIVLGSYRNAEGKSCLVVGYGSLNKHAWKVVTFCSLGQLAAYNLLGNVCTPPACYYPDPKSPKPPEPTPAPEPTITTIPTSPQA